MEQQPNDSFDKLFRKVADKYPLNTKNKNWDIVAARLKEQKLTAKIKSNKRWQLVVLLLLITFGSFGIYFYSQNTFKTKQLSENIASVSSKKTVQQPSQNIQKPINQNRAGDNISINDNQSVTAINQKKSNDKLSSALEKNNDENSLQSFITLNKHQNSGSDIYALSDVDDFRLAKLSASKNNYAGVISKNLNQTQSLYLLVNNKPAESNNLNQQKKSTPLKLRTKPVNVLYGSFFMSPDFATVKYQQINAPGFKIGVQLGYRISNSFSAEISLVRSHSDFYTLGKYFDKSHAKINTNTTINKVHGKSKMTDVPFAVRFNFPKTNNKFFVTAGTNFILLTHTEQYKYDVTKSNGTYGKVLKNFSANSGTKYFSNVNVSAGYETPLVGSFRIKAEPYYQIPTKNFGIGSLPVTHFGVNIGIVKDLK